MDRLPGLVFIADIRKDITAFKEANRKGIPVVAIVDTNVDPTDVAFPIPANDDSMRSITLVTKVITDAVIEGTKGFETEEEVREEHGSGNG